MSKFSLWLTYSICKNTKRKPQQKKINVCELHNTVISSMPLSFNTWRWTRVSVLQNIHRTMKGTLMKDELERIWNESGVALSSLCPPVCWRQWRRSWDSLDMGCYAWDVNQTPTEYKSSQLPVCQSLQVSDTMSHLLTIPLVKSFSAWMAANSEKS